ncbi:hypothetical protein [Jiangella gansuensis]|uniref:hypothetical protein n=1 Tax=Jiangella gansuensis TaxID=281473 RepID=UPI0004B960B2|nr:hypothetical protein [Jiangella gansuensis]
MSVAVVIKRGMNKSTLALTFADEDEARAFVAMSRGTTKLTKKGYDGGPVDFVEVVTPDEYGELTGQSDFVANLAARKAANAKANAEAEKQRQADKAERVRKRADDERQAKLDELIEKKRATEAEEFEAKLRKEAEAELAKIEKAAK